MVLNFLYKNTAQTAKSRINIGKFGDISLAFLRERKNEPKQKVANLYEKKSRNCMKTATNLPKWRMSG